MPSFGMPFALYIRPRERVGGTFEEPSEERGVSKLSTANVIMVIDPSETDYEPLKAAGQASGIGFTFLATADEALRSPAPAGVLAWMINMQLPDMSGLELYQLLRSRLANVPVLMVDDQYDAAREVSVLTIGRLHYVCKPLDSSWVEKLGRENCNGNT